MSSFCKKRKRFFLSLCLLGHTFVKPWWCRWPGRYGDPGCQRLLTHFAILYMFVLDFTVQKTPWFKIVVCLPIWPWRPDRCRVAFCQWRMLRLNMRLSADKHRSTRREQWRRSRLRRRRHWHTPLDFETALLDWAPGLRVRLHTPVFGWRRPCRQARRQIANFIWAIAKTTPNGACTPQFGCHFGGGILRRVNPRFSFVE